MAESPNGNSRGGFRTRSISGVVNFADFNGRPGIDDSSEVANTISGLRELSQTPIVVRCIVSQEHWLGGGTPHLQFAFWFKGPTAITQAFRRRYHLRRAALEAVKATPGQMWYYCAKEGQDRDGQPLVPHNVVWGEKVILTKGEPPAPGKRNDLQAVADAISSGSTPADVARDFTVQSIRFPRGIQNTYALLQGKMPRRLEDLPTVLTLVGPTGTGKTARIQSFSDTLLIPPYVWSAETGDFWENYFGQLSIHLEEFRGQLKRGSLLQLLDRYPYRVNQKGASSEMQASQFFITSPKLPIEWYQWDDTDAAEQLERRLTGNDDSRIYHTGWNKFIDYKGNILEPQPEWGRWNQHESAPMTTVN